MTFSDLFTATIGTANEPEIAWTLVATIGLLFSMIVISNAKVNLNIVHSERNRLTAVDFDLMQDMARSHLINELLRITAHGISAIVGVVAMSTAPANPDKPVTQLGWIIALVLITKASLHVAASIKDLRTRRRMLARLICEDYRAGMQP